MQRDLLIPVHKFQRLLDYMERIGLDGDAMLAPLQMSPAQLRREDPQATLPGPDYARVYRIAVRQMQTLKRPIPWAAGIGSEAFELMSHGIIGSRTLGDALELAQRYDQLMYPMLGYRMNLQRDSEEFRLCYHVRISPEESVFAPEDWDRFEHVETVAKASGLLVWFSFCGWLIGRSIDPNGLNIAGPPVSDGFHASLLNVVHCPIEYDSAENCLVAPASYLEHRLVHTVDSLQEFLDNAVYELISISSKPSSTSAAIRSLIKLDFGTGLPSFEQMADNLHMSESSLRRRLLKEDTSYQKIKDQVRCEVAIEHLRREETRINDLADLLGFTEPSSFVRSFRSWMGITPKAYRDQMKLAAAGE